MGCKRSWVFWAYALATWAVAQEAVMVDLPVRLPSPLQLSDLRPGGEGMRAMTRADNPGDRPARLSVKRGAAFQAGGGQLVMAAATMSVVVSAGARGVPFSFEYLCAQADLPDPDPGAGWQEASVTPAVGEKRKYLEQLAAGVERVDQELAALAPKARARPSGSGVEIDYEGDPLSEESLHLLRAGDWSVSSAGTTQVALNRSVVVQFAFWALTDSYTEEDFRRRLEEAKFQSVRTREASVVWAVRHLLSFSRFKQEIFDAHSAEAAYNRGVDGLQAGADHEAEALFKTALERREKYAAAQFNLAIICARQGRLDEAKTLWEAVSRRVPKDADTLYNLGVVAYRQGRWQGAVRYFEQSLERDPSHRLASQWLPRARKRS